MKQCFKGLWSNDDVLKYRLAQEVLQGKHRWLEQGCMGTDRRRPTTPSTPEPSPVEAETLR